MYTAKINQARTLKVILVRDSDGTGRAGLLPADVDIRFQKADDVGLTAMVLDGTNFVEVDAVLAPGVYAVTFSAAQLDTEGDFHAYVQRDVVLDLAATFILVSVEVAPEIAPGSVSGSPVSDAVDHVILTKSSPFTINLGAAGSALQEYALYAFKDGVASPDAILSFTALYGGYYRLELQPSLLLESGDITLTFEKDGVGAANQYALPAGAGVVLRSSPASAVVVEGGGGVVVILLGSVVTKFFIPDVGDIFFDDTEQYGPVGYEVYGSGFILLTGDLFTCGSVSATPALYKEAGSGGILTDLTAGLPASGMTRFYDLSAVSSDEVWAVSSNGTNGEVVQWTTGGGAVVAQAAAVDFRAVYAASAAEVHAAGGDSIYRKSGATWSDFTFSTAGSFRAMDFNADSTVGVAVGTEGKFVRTSDSGATWEALPGVPFSATDNFVDVKVVTSTTWIAVTETKIFKTEDSGANWSASTVTTTGTVAGVTITVADQVVLFGADGRVWLMDDEGTGFQKTIRVSVTLPTDLSPILADLEAIKGAGFDSLEHALSVAKSVPDGAFQGNISVNGSTVSTFAFVDKGARVEGITPPGVVAEAYANGVSVSLAPVPIAEVVGSPGTYTFSLSADYTTAPGDFTVFLSPGDTIAPSFLDWVIDDVDLGEYVEAASIRLNVYAYEGSLHQNARVLQTSLNGVYSGYFSEGLSGPMNWVQDVSGMILSDDSYRTRKGDVSPDGRFHMVPADWNNDNFSGVIYYRTVTDDPAEPNHPAGTPWLSIATPIRAAGYYILWTTSVLDENNAWLAGERGTVVHWNGTTMGLQFEPALSEYFAFLSIFAVDALTVWAVGRDGLTYKTVDGGTTWTDESGTFQVYDAGRYQLHAVEFSRDNPLLGFICGVVQPDTYLQGAVWRTTDGGLTWTEQILDAPNGLPVSADNRVGSWDITRRTVGPDGVPIVNSTTWLLAGSWRNPAGGGFRGTIAESNDDGLTWSYIYEADPDNVELLSTISENLSMGSVVHTWPEWPADPYYSYVRQEVDAGASATEFDPVTLKWSILPEQPVTPETDLSPILADLEAIKGAGFDSLEHALSVAKVAADGGAFQGVIPLNGTVKNVFELRSGDALVSGVTAPEVSLRAFLNGSAVVIEPVPIEPVAGEPGLYTFEVAGSVASAAGDFTVYLAPGEGGAGDPLSWKVYQYIDPLGAIPPNPDFSFADARNIVVFPYQGDLHQNVRAYIAAPGYAPSLYEGFWTSYGTDEDYFVPDTVLAGDVYDAAVSFDTRTHYAVGSNFYVKVVVDVGGAPLENSGAWSLVTKPTLSHAYELFGVSAFSGTEAWTCGERGFVLHFDGSTLTQQPLPGSFARGTGPGDLLGATPNNELRAIFVVSENTVWVGGSGGLLYVTTDGGATWTDKSSDLPVGGGFGGAIDNFFIEGIAFDRSAPQYGAVVGYLSGFPGTGVALRTSDGGVTWFRDESSEVVGRIYWDVDIRRLNNAGEALPAGGGDWYIAAGIIDGGESAAVLRSVDKGATWTLDHLKPNEGSSQELFCISEGVGVGGMYEDGPDGFASAVLKESGGVSTGPMFDPVTMKWSVVPETSSAAGGEVLGRPLKRRGALTL